MELAEDIIDKETKFINFFGKLDEKREVLKLINKEELKFIASRGYVESTLMSIFKLIDESLEYKDIEGLTYYMERLHQVIEYLMLEEHHDFYICSIVNKMIALYAYNPTGCSMILGEVLVDLIGISRGEREYALCLYNNKDSLIEIIPLIDEDCYDVNMLADEVMALQMFKLKDYLKSIKYLERRYSFRLTVEMKKMIIDMMTISRRYVIL